MGEFLSVGFWRGKGYVRVKCDGFRYLRINRHDLEASIARYERCSCVNELYVTITRRRWCFCSLPLPVHSGLVRLRNVRV